MFLPVDDHPKFVLFFLPAETRQLKLSQLAFSFSDYLRSSVDAVLNENSRLSDEGRISCHPPSIEA